MVFRRNTYVMILIEDEKVVNFISPPNICIHRKSEVPGSKCAFTARN